MKTALSCLAILASTPVAAFDTMTPSMCRDSFDTAVQMAGADGTEARRIGTAIFATLDGWCRVSASALGLQDAVFTTLDWRSDATARWTEDAIPPLAVQLRIKGIDPDRLQDSAPTDRPDLSAQATLRQDPAGGQLILERAVLRNGAGDEVALSGVIDRVFLSSAAMLQVSVGSAALRAGILTMTLEGTYENPFGVMVDMDMQGDVEARRRAVFDGLSRLPEGVMDAAARAELMAYAGDLPAPAGTLEVSFASERGLGFMQLGASAAMTLSNLMAETPDADRRQMGLLLDGVTLDADWTPATQVAD